MEVHQIPYPQNNSRFFKTFPLHKITLVLDFKSNWISDSVTSFTSFLDLEVFSFTWS